jgi:hypothetical protein
MTMDELDGNAIGGLLHDVFGAEMTAVPVTCGSCGWHGVIARLAVYRPGMGTVVRCCSCRAVLMVFVSKHAMRCADLTGLARVG